MLTALFAKFYSSSFCCRGSALDDDLSAANKAAKAAAAARHGPKMPSVSHDIHAIVCNICVCCEDVITSCICLQIQSVSAPQGVSSSATQERWHCSCGKTNTGFRERCSSCNRPNPIAPASKETERKVGVLLCGLVQYSVTGLQIWLAKVPCC